MLDYNHRPGIAERVNAAIDAALIAEREATPPRTYLGASRLGHACERALQFEFAGAPKDQGADFGGQTLRIFEIGHQLEDLAIGWLRAAGIDLYTRKGIRLRPGRPIRRECRAGCPATRKPGSARRFGSSAPTSRPTRPRSCTP